MPILAPASYSRNSMAACREARGWELGTTVTTQKAEIGFNQLKVTRQVSSQKLQISIIATSDNFSQNNSFLGVETETDS